MHSACGLANGNVLISKNKEIELGIQKDYKMTLDPFGQAQDLRGILPLDINIGLWCNTLVLNLQKFSTEFT